MVREHDVNEAQQIQADGLPADERGVSSDHPLLLQPAQALLQARARQVEPARQLGAADAGIILQLGQQSQVQLVEAGPAGWFGRRPPPRILTFLFNNRPPDAQPR
jgi:hypothetical protein